METTPLDLERSHQEYLEETRRMATRRRIRISLWQVAILAVLLGSWEL